MAEVMGCLCSTPRAACGERGAELWRGFVGRKVGLGETGGEGWHGKIGFSMGEKEAFSTDYASY